MSRSKISLEERIRATLFGLAWGDALGCPVEGWRSGQIQEVYGEYDGLPQEYPFEAIALRGKKTLKRLRPLGLHSDDAQQAMALLNVCLAHEEWDLEAWAACLVAGMQGEAWRGIGRNFTMALHKLARGVPPQKSGSASAGIGAAMRIAPLGALYRDDPVLLARVVMESTLATHGDIRAAAMSYAVAYTVSSLLAGNAPSTIRGQLPAAVEAVEREWLEEQPAWQIDRSAGHLISRSLQRAFKRVPTQHEDIRSLVSRVAKPHLAKGFKKAHPNQGFALLGGLHALMMALFGGDDPQDILLSIIRQGYDTDTVAAICGGILGARFGSSWIPTHRLRDETNLLRYADALIEGKEAPETLETLLEREAEYSLQEQLFQENLVRTYRALLT